MENILVSISIVSSSFGVQKGRRLFKVTVGCFPLPAESTWIRHALPVKRYEAYFEVPYTLLIWQIVFFVNFSCMELRFLASGSLSSAS